MNFTQKNPYELPSCSSTFKSVAQVHGPSDLLIRDWL